MASRLFWMRGKERSMPDNDAALIRELKNALAVIWSVNDKHDWPVRLNTVSHLFAGEFFKDMHNAFYSLVEKGCSLNEIGLLIGSPSRIFRSFDLIFRGMYINKVPVTQKRKFICDLLKCIQSMKQGSPFNSNGCNHILDQNSLDEIRNGYVWNTADMDASMTIHGFIGLLKAYIEMLYFRIYDISQEIHGPYAINGGGSLLIREFTELSPDKLWSEFQLLSCNSISIYAQYDESVKVAIDSYNHMSQVGEGFTGHLLRWRVNVDGNEITDIIEILHLKNMISDAIRNNAIFFENNDWRFYARKYADICWYKIEALLKAASISNLSYKLVASNIMNGEINIQNERFFEDSKIGMLLNIII